VSTALVEPVPSTTPAAATPLSARLTWLGRIFPLQADDLILLARLVAEPVSLDELDDPSDAAMLPLVQCNLAHNVDGRRLCLDPRIRRYLEGDDALDPRLATFTRVSAAPPALLPPHAEVERGLTRLAGMLAAEGRTIRVRLIGPRGIGCERTAAGTAAALGIPMLVVDLERAPAGALMSELVDAILLEAWLRNALLYIDGVEALRAAGRPHDASIVLGAVAADRGITVLAAERHSAEPLVPDLISLPLELPGAPVRRLLWADAIETNALELGGEALRLVSERFRLTPGEIEQAAAEARGRLDWSRALGDPMTGADAVLVSARAQCGHELAALAFKTEARARWDDLVLPAASSAQLRELCDRVVQRERVLEAWGFAARLGYGTSPTALFHGPSGTGKTMAAAVIAGELRQDLYRVDLARVISKYIGETEKNLDAIFAAAERSNAILLFDEADALFGKRSEVKDAHDRYANVEISYLLQRMEAYDGVAILTTNLRGHLDEAFTRRLAFVVHFPLPDESARLALWRGIWPADLPLAPDVDLEHLARAYRLSGGNIKNVALAAAFAAASQSAAIAMSHLLHGIRREYAKMGKELDAGEMDAAWHAATGSR
jgi:hypothetical protein